MEIKLKKAWLSNGEEISCGWALQPETYNDGVINREGEILFTTDGKNIIRQSWSKKIFFSKKEAECHIEESKKEDIKYAKKQIEYYNNRLLELDKRSKK